MGRGLAVTLGRNTELGWWLSSLFFLILCDLFSFPQQRAGKSLRKGPQPSTLCLGASWKFCICQLLHFPHGEQPPDPTGRSHQVPLVNHPSQS